MAVSKQINIQYEKFFVYKMSMDELQYTKIKWNVYMNTFVYCKQS